MAARSDVDNAASAAVHATMPGHVDRARAARLMEQAGLSNVVFNEYMIKTVAIHVGTKLRNTVK